MPSPKPSFSRVLFLLRTRWIYLWVTGLVLVIGYLSRQWSVRGSFVHEYVGDAIWAGMIYFGFRFLFAGDPLKKSLLTAWGFTYLIELSQLYQADWLNAVRHTWLGGLVLGFSFLWSDLLMYALGILSAWLVDRFMLAENPAGGRHPQAFRREA